MKMMRKNTLISQGRGGVDAYNASDDGFLERCVVHCERGLCARLQLKSMRSKVRVAAHESDKDGNTSKSCNGDGRNPFLPAQGERS